MTPRASGLGPLLGLVLLAGAALAEPATPSPWAKAPAPRSGEVARPRANASARRGSGRSVAVAHAVPPAAAAKPAAPRRLEDVSIEGEVPVPQVLFVTAREQRRGIEFQHHRYLATGRTLGEATPLPRWIATPQNPPPSR